MASISVLPVTGQAAVKGSSSRQGSQNADWQNSAAQFAGILGGWIAQFMTGGESAENSLPAKEGSPASVVSINASQPDLTLQKLWTGLLDKVQENPSGGLKNNGTELKPNELPVYQGSVPGPTVPGEYAEIEKLLQELSGEIKNIPVFSGQNQSTNISRMFQALLWPQLPQAFGADIPSQTTQPSQLTEIAKLAQFLQMPESNGVLRIPETSELSRQPETNDRLQILKDLILHTFKGADSPSSAEMGRDTSPNEAEFSSSIVAPTDLWNDGKITKNNDANPGPGLNATAQKQSEALKILNSPVVPNNRPTELAGGAQKTGDVTKQADELTQPSNSTGVSLTGKEAGTQVFRQSTQAGLGIQANPQAVSAGQNFRPAGEGNIQAPAKNIVAGGIQLMSGIEQSIPAGGQNDKGQGAGPNTRSDGRESSYSGRPSNQDTVQASFYMNTTSGADKGNLPQHLSLKGQTLNQSVWEQTAALIHSSLQGKKEVRALEIQLHPAELGRIQVNLHWEGDQVHLQVQASDAMTGRLLHTHLQDLRQALEQAGVNCGSMQMGFGGEQRDNPWQQGFAKMSFTQRSLNTEPNEQAQEAYPAQVVSGEQILNIMA